MNRKKRLSLFSVALVVCLFVLPIVALAEEFTVADSGLLESSEQQKIFFQNNPNFLNRNRELLLTELSTENGNLQVPTEPSTENENGNLQIPTEPPTENENGNLQVPTEPPTENENGNLQIPTENGEIHNHAYIQKNDAINHWKECECSDIIQKENHRYNDNECTVCGFIKFETKITTFEELSDEITEQWVTKDTAAENLVLPKELNATDEKGQTILVEKIVWEHEKINSENQDQERYLFTAKLPEGYVLAEGVTMPTITVIVENAKGTQILFENGIHYIIDPDYPDHKITLFCMNNKLHWPHHTEDMGEIQVPGYTDGYLTPDDFKSQKDYNECMRRLSKLLYAGYPYNGERLYQIVTNSSEYTPTEAEFNQMLIVPPVLQTAYPYLGHHDFTYADWANDNKEHIDYLRKFIGDAIKLGNSQGTTTNGLTATDIYAMPFYKAAFSIINCNNDTPLEAFQFYYGASYFVTEEEAYNATQNAVWHLLHEYNIPDNNINALNSELANVLYTYSERGGLLDYKPSLSEIKLSGNLTFTYNPKDGMWHSSSLRLIEPEEYRGLYHLILPEGMTALYDNLTYVK